MTAFNPRHLAREIPALTWRAYLTSRSVAIPEELDWDAEEQAFAEALSALLEGLEPGLQARLQAELRHVHALATPRGMDALLNASDNAALLREDFGELHNPAERALWVLVHWPDTFMAAEALLRFDLGVGKRSWKRQIINVTAPVSREAADIAALEQALAGVLSRRRGPRRACRVAGSPCTSARSPMRYGRPTTGTRCALSDAWQPPVSWRDRSQGEELPRAAGCHYRGGPLGGGTGPTGEEPCRAQARSPCTPAEPAGRTIV